MKHVMGKTEVYKDVRHTRQRLIGSLKILGSPASYWIIAKDSIIMHARQLPQKETRASKLHRHV